MHTAEHLGYIHRQSFFSLSVLFLSISITIARYHNTHNPRKYRPIDTPKEQNQLVTPSHPSAPSSGIPSQEKIPTLSEVSTSSSDTGGDSLSSEDEENREYESIVVEEEDICGSDSEDEEEEARLSVLEKAINQQGRFLQTLLEQQTEFQQQLGVIVQSIPNTNT